MKHLPEQPRRSQNLFSKVARIIFWVSPLLAVAENTYRAITSTYHERLLADPGHRRVKIYDRFILSVGILMAGILFAVSVDYYTNKAEWMTSGAWFYVFPVLFPHISNIYLTLALYCVYVLTLLYGNRREHIIRSINEKEGVW